MQNRSASVQASRRCGAQGPAIEPAADAGWTRDKSHHTQAAGSSRESQARRTTPTDRQIHEHVAASQISIDDEP